VATAVERQHQHAMAVSAARRFDATVDGFRQEPARPRPARAKARTAAASVERPSRPSATPYAERLLAGIPWWQFAVRRAARQEGERQADLEHQRLIAKYEQRRQEQTAEAARLEREREVEQRLLDRVHQRIADGDAHAVALAVGTALDALPFAAELVSIDGHEAALRVTVAHTEGAVPEREPTYTAAGKPSTRKLNQTERNERHCELICGAALATARTALGVAPSLRRAAVVVRVDHGRELVAVAYCSVQSGGWTRWSSSQTNVMEAFYDADGWIEQAGRTRAVQPLDLSDMPEVPSALLANRVGA
jgi:hypothetical protein